MNDCHDRLPRILSNCWIWKKIKCYSNSATRRILNELNTMCLKNNSNIYSRLFFFMNWCYMFIQVLLSCKASLTNIALKWPLSFMTWCYMCIQVLLSCKASCTNVTFERPFAFMNWCNMFLQATLFWKASITNVALKKAFFFHELMPHVCSSVTFVQSLHHKCCNERLFFFINWCHMYLQVAFYDKGSCIWKAFFLYELNQCGFSCFDLTQNQHHKCCI